MAYISQRTYLGMRPHRALKRPLCGADAPDAPNNGEYIQVHPQNSPAIHPKRGAVDLGSMYDK